MEIVVTVVGGVPGGGDHGREEVFGSAFLLLQEDLVDEAFEDAPLFGRGRCQVGYACVLVLPSFLESSSSECSTGR